MKSQKLFALVAMTPNARYVIGNDNLKRLHDAHPNVKVEIVDQSDDFLRLVGSADCLVVSNGFAIPSLALAHGSLLKWVQCVHAGVDGVLTPELKAADHIPFTATKGPMGSLMAEHAVMMMLSLARSMPEYLADRARREWGFLGENRNVYEIWGKTVAILGVGSVGGSLARMCKAGFEMRVLGLSRVNKNSPHVDRYFEREELHSALAEADFVAMTLALTPETKHIIDAEALGAMKPTAFLVNVTRGGLVDESALIDSLTSGGIAGAGLDATETEPPPNDSPLWILPNVILTPHIAPGRDRVGSHMVDFWCDNIRRFAEGQPLMGLVDREAGY